MAEKFQRADPASIAAYHAHIYYAAKTRTIAARLRSRIERRFPVRMGRWHDEAVGPHPVSMYQVAFPATLFPRIVPWLMTNRDGLTILVHPETGDDYIDHAQYGIWLGEKIALRLEVFGGSRRSDRRATSVQAAKKPARSRRRVRP